MVFSYLEKLRRKPVKVRKTYTMFFTIAFTSIIVLFWLTTIFLNNLGTRSGEDTEESVKNPTSQLFNESNVFMDSNNTQYTNTTNNWTQQLKQFDDESLMEEGTSSERFRNQSENTTKHYGVESE